MFVFVLIKFFKLVSDKSISKQNQAWIQRGYGKFQKKKNYVIGSNKNNDLVVKFKLITRKP